MKGIILLNSNENTRQVEEEEKSKFARSILEAMGVPLDNIWNDNDDLTLENKIKLRKLLATYSVSIIDSADGELKIYVEEQGKEPTLVGVWNKCEYVLKRDNKQLDPKKRLFLQMKINYWSIFEQENE